MSQITEKELALLEELMRYEEALYEKFHHFAECASEEATRKLCLQLGDRSREHYAALAATLSSSGPVH